MSECQYEVTFWRAEFPHTILWAQMEDPVIICFVHLTP